jgi:hypothetical protein
MAAAIQKQLGQTQVAGIKPPHPSEFREQSRRAGRMASFDSICLACNQGGFPCRKTGFVAAGMLTLQGNSFLALRVCGCASNETESH